MFTNFYADSSWAKLILYQIIAGIGIGPLFQSPLIALQTQVKPRDIATATATFGFVRQLATSTSVVIGQVVYQNQMAKRTPQLMAALGPQVAQQLSGSGAGANVGLIDALPAAQRTVAQTAFADSLHPMWIMYVCFSAVGLIISFFIKKKKLSNVQEEAKTGLAAEKENQEARVAEKAAKAEKRRSQATGGGSVATSRPVSGISGVSGDLEKGVVPDMPAMPRQYGTRD